MLRCISRLEIAALICLLLCGTAAGARARRPATVCRCLRVLAVADMVAIITGTEKLRAVAITAVCPDKVSDTAGGGREKAFLRRIPSHMTGRTPVRPVILYFRKSRVGGSIFLLADVEPLGGWGREIS